MLHDYNVQLLKRLQKKKRRIWTSLLLLDINRPRPILPIDPQSITGSLGQTWRAENTYHGALYFYSIFILLFVGKVSGVSVQDMQLRLPFLKPDT